MADYFVDPLCRGIYAGKAKDLSIKSCFAQLFDAEQQHGSVVLGGITGLVRGLFKPQPQAGPISTLSKRAKQERWSIYTLRDGLQSLPKTLYKKLSGQVKVITNMCCTKLEFTDNGTVKVSTILSFFILTLTHRRDIKKNKNQIFKIRWPSRTDKHSIKFIDLYPVKYAMKNDFLQIFGKINLSVFSCEKY